MLTFTFILHCQHSICTHGSVMLAGSIISWGKTLTGKGFDGHSKQNPYTFKLTTLDHRYTKRSFSYLFFVHNSYSFVINISIQMFDIAYYNWRACICALLW